MPENPRQLAREKIDGMLAAAGWDVQKIKTANILAAAGVAIGRFPLLSPYGIADYALYIKGKAAGIIEIKDAGTKLTGVNIGSEKYTHGLPETLPVWKWPLPFSYQSTGDETVFTNNLERSEGPQPIETFHSPEELFHLLGDPEPDA